MKYLMMLAAVPLGITDYILWNMLMIQEYGYRTLTAAIKENYDLLMEDKDDQRTIKITL